MSKERELLQEALNWMLDLSDIYTDEGPEDDRLLLRLVDDINKIKELLAQPEQEQFPLPGERLIGMWRDGYDAGVRLFQFKQEPVVWMYEFAVRSSFDASFTGEWKEEISRTKPDGVVKGFNPTKLESTVRNLVPLYASPPKRDPLSEDAICEILLKKEWKGFVELVRQIEKQHNIGE